MKLKYLIYLLYVLVIISSILSIVYFAKKKLFWLSYCLDFFNFMDNVEYRKVVLLCLSLAKSKGKGGGPR